jgi:beta-N-acetylhexosaminidase
MTVTDPSRPADPTLARWADGVLLPCFDGTVAPDWVRRRIGGGLVGICLFARNIGTGGSLGRLTTSLAAERENVIVAIDEEAGDVTRIDAAAGSRFPGAAAIGRADDVALTEIVARQVGEMLAAAGVTLNFAPCADVAADPSNPVIGSRSFGDDPELVSRHSAAWVSGQQSVGVAACAKHFPGHGDTDTDTHRSLAVIDLSLESLQLQHIPPFRAAFDAGVASVMAGHLLVPSVDSLPASVSRRWLTEILRGDMGFEGAIVTDALEMAAVRDMFGIPGAAVQALLAGADLLCIGGDPMDEAALDAVRDAIVAAVVAGELPADRLADAATRSAELGTSWASARAATRREPGVWDAGPSAKVADRAVSIAGPIPTLATPTLVLRCEETPNIAVGVIPWGLAGALPVDLRATDRPIREGDPLPGDALSMPGSIVVATRDRHRHPWMRRLVDSVRAVRPDAILVEMGITGVESADAPAIASFGATRASSAAVARVLAGPAVTRR